MKKTAMLALLVSAIGCINPGALFAESVEEVLTLHQNSMDMIWLIIAASLVFFMQAGFAMVETGLTRAKNASNIIMKNLMDFCTGAVVFWAVGWALMYGASASGLVGSSQFFIRGAGPAMFRDWMFQVVFAATAATIVSGAMAERTKFSSYLLYIDGLNMMEFFLKSFFVIFLFNPGSLALIILSVLVGIFVPITHRKNISRLINGSESKFSLKKKK